ncbi:MAG: type II toxin-antitoxin system HicA family toxin [Clostridiales bacterium]|nr:type II toxin-antitoxin system HicA family toxin [Clostridiales bacterium]
MNGVKMTMGLCLPPKKLIDFLEYNGFSFIRAKGTSHHIYSNEKVSLPIPVHGSKELGEILIRQILRESGLTKSQLLSWLGRN